MSHYTKASSYSVLGERGINRRARNWVKVFHTWYQVGVCASRINITAEAIHMFFQNMFGLVYNEGVISVMVALVSFLMCLPRSIGLLTKIFSLAGLVVFTLIFTTLIYFATSFESKKLCVNPKSDDPGHLWSFYSISLYSGDALHQIGHWLKYFPTLQNNFAVHPFVPGLLQQLPGPALPKKNFVRMQAKIVAVVAWLAYLIVGFLTAVMFGGENKDNLFKSYSVCYSPFVDVLYLVYSVLVIMGVPVTFQSTRDRVLKQVRKDGFWVSALVALIFNVACCAVAQIPSPQIIYGLFSATSGFVMFILVPSLLFCYFPQIKSKYRFMDSLRFVQNEDAFTNLQRLNIATELRNADAEKLGDDQQVEEQEVFVTELTIKRKIATICIVSAGALTCAVSFGMFMKDLADLVLIKK